MTHPLELDGVTVRAGGGIGFARLAHASAHEALKILVARHRHNLPWAHHGTLPSSAPW